MDEKLSSKNPLANKVDKILSFDLQPDTFVALKNVSELIVENNLTTRRNLRANIETQSLLINEDFIRRFEMVYKNFQKLCDCVSFIDVSCKQMMQEIEDIKFKTSDFVKQANEINTELERLDINEKILSKFLEEYQLSASELALIDNSSDSTTPLKINAEFFDVLNKIRSIHQKSRTMLANNQYITGFEIMELMSKYEEMANDKLYRWTLGILRTINLDTIEMHSLLFTSLALLQGKDILFKNCMEEYTTVRRSAVSHSFIQALTRSRPSTNQHSQTTLPAIELYSNNIVRYINDMLAFLHQSVAFERDMLKTLFKSCNQELLVERKTVKTILSSIVEGVIRPLKIRIENCLVSGSKLTKSQPEKKYKIDETKDYFLVKNIINFYMQTFGQILLEDSEFSRFIKEMLILSDKVFYNNLNLFCSFISQKWDVAMVEYSSKNLTSLEQINDFVRLVDQLLDCIKTSMSFTSQEQQLETHRILTCVIEPFFQYVLVFSSKLSSVEMTVFAFNCVHLLKQKIDKYNFTADFSKNLQIKLDEFQDSLVDEQFLHIISTLSITSFYNAIKQNLAGSTPLSSLSGCDPVTVGTFLNIWDQFMADPEKLKLNFIKQVNDQESRKQIWRKSLLQIAVAYEEIFAALNNPKNKFTEFLNSLKHQPTDVKSHFETISNQ